MIDVEGVLLPNVPLSNFQLSDAAEKLKLKGFKGVFLRNKLPKRPAAFDCGILNLDDSIGTHWCCWYKLKNDKFYFDSYGLPPPIELVRYLKSSVNYNSEKIQPDNAVCCGHLCLYVLKKMQDGLGFQEVINTLF
jgi:hypothetical protein